jgi:hypothetical protein
LGKALNRTPSKCRVLGWHSRLIPGANHAGGGKLGNCKSQPGEAAECNPTIRNYRTSNCGRQAQPAYAWHFELYGCASPLCQMNLELLMSCFTPSTPSPRRNSSRKFLFICRANLRKVFQIRRQFTQNLRVIVNMA